MFSDFFDITKNFNLKHSCLTDIYRNDVSHKKPWTVKSNVSGVWEVFSQYSPMEPKNEVSVPGYFCHHSQIIHSIIIKYLSAKKISIPSCEPITSKDVKLICIGIDRNFTLWKQSSPYVYRNWFSILISWSPSSTTRNAKESFGCTKKNHKHSIRQAKAIIG